jgi:outer membrane protein OmpA-like peptidoglycan-associated protein
MLKIIRTLFVFLVLVGECFAQDVQLFNPVNDSHNFIVTESSDIIKPGVVVYSSYANYARNVVVLRGMRGGISTSENVILENLTTVDFLFSKSFLGIFDLTIAVPYGFSSGTKNMFTTSQNDGSGLNNIRIIPKINIIKRKGNGFGMAVSLPQSLPAQNEQRDKITSFGFTMVRLIGDLKIGNFEVAVNAAYRYRFDNIAKTENSSPCGITNIQREYCTDPLYRGPGIYYSMGIRYYLRDRTIQILIDVQGKYFYEQKKDNPIEIFGGLRFDPEGEIYTTISLSSSLGQTVGTNLLRFIVGIGFRQEPMKDSDDDGVEDKRDLCRYEKEDFDRYEDSDGCPDLDNDNDGIEDSADKCERLSEDLDGFEDTDGCPDLDNDNDGLPDTKDMCPWAPEDNDGVSDFDGCPDEEFLEMVVSVPKSRKGKIIHINPNKAFHFDRETNQILDKSEDALGDIIKALQKDPKILKISVEVHTDNSLSEEISLEITQKRADAISEALIKKGVDAKRVSAKGFGSSEPLKPNTTEKGRMENKRIYVRIIEYQE